MFFSKIKPEKIKKQNTKWLNAQGIKVIDHLPHIELNEFQRPERVAQRCLILATTIQLYFGAPNEFVENYLIENGLWDELTEEEIERLKVNYEDWDDQEKTDLYWTIEAIWALTWVGKKHDGLSFNEGVGDSLVTFLPDFQKEEPAQHFIQNFKLRSEKEIFTVLDSFYRAHWFARNLSLTGQQSPLVNLDIIMERRKALEWVCNVNQDWDEISLDT